MINLLLRDYFSSFYDLISDFNDFKVNTEDRLLNYLLINSYKEFKDIFSKIYYISNSKDNNNLLTLEKLLLNIKEIRKLEQVNLNNREKERFLKYIIIKNYNKIMSFSLNIY